MEPLVEHYVNPKTGECEVTPLSIGTLVPGSAVQFASNEQAHPIRVSFPDASLFGVDSFEVAAGETVEHTVQDDATQGNNPYVIECLVTGKKWPGEGGGEPTIIIGG